MSEPTKRQKRIRKMQSYTKYSGMTYQLFGLLAITVFFGLKADAYFGHESKLITAGATLFVLIGYLYKVSITVMKK